MLVLGAQHGMATAYKEWSGAQDDMQKKLFGQMAQCLRDHDEAPAAAAGPEDWMEDDELVESELIVLLAAGVVEKCGVSYLHLEYVTIHFIGRQE